MNEVMIFGECIPVLEQEGKDSVQLKDSKILITSHQESASNLLNEFLENTLYSELFRIYEQIKKKRGIEVLGDLDFEIMKKIDRKEERIAKLKGNRILVKKNAIMLPRQVLEYIIAHELAHVTTKRHTKLFWKTVELMCPNFERAQELLTKYSILFREPFHIKINQDY
jgi:predicted metal-dependent hydrolase